MDGMTKTLLKTYLGREEIRDIIKHESFNITGKGYASIEDIDSFMQVVLGRSAPEFDDSKYKYCLEVEDVPYKIIEGPQLEVVYKGNCIRLLNHNIFSRKENREVLFSAENGHTLRVTDDYNSTHYIYFNSLEDFYGFIYQSGA